MREGLGICHLIESPFAVAGIGSRLSAIVIINCSTWVGSGELAKRQILPPEVVILK